MPMDRATFEAALEEQGFSFDQETGIYSTSYHGEQLVETIVVTDEGWTYTEVESGLVFTGTDFAVLMDHLDGVEAIPGSGNPFGD